MRLKKINVILHLLGVLQVSLPNLLIDRKEDRKWEMRIINY